VTAVERITAAIFSNQIEALTEQDFAQLAQDGLPSSHFDLSEVGLLTLLVESGLATTPKGEVTQGQARKLIMGNSVAVNGVKQIDPEFKLQAKRRAMVGTIWFKRAKSSTIWWCSRVEGLR